MVHFTLPRNSKVQRGKTWNQPDDKGSWKEFRIYRWNPDGDENPRIDTYWVDTGADVAARLTLLVRELKRCRPE